MRAAADYFSGLPSEAGERYTEKIRLINGLDPFSSSLGKAVDAFPPVDASDLVSYLVLQTSFMTSQQFKARKSLEAYNFFVSGWIKEVKSFIVSEKFVVVGRVSKFT